MRIDLEGCSPGGGPAAAATPSPTPEEGLANVHFSVTWMCRGDVQETFVRPLFGATVKIDGQEYETETMQSGRDFVASVSARGLRPGRHKVTVLLPAEGEDYEFAYVASGTESVFPGTVPPEKYYPDQTGDAVVPLKEGDQALNFRLIRDCSERFSQNYKYEVLKLKGRWSDYHVEYGDQKLGHPPLKEGGTVGNGDVIETYSEGAVLLEAKYVGPGKAPNESRYYVMVHPNTKVRLFFIKGEPDEYVPKFFVQYGTISQKIIDEPVGLPRREKNRTVTVEDPTAVGFDNGTIFSWSYERQRQETTVSVEEGSVAVKPQNPRLQSVTVGPGQQILVSRNSVSPARPGSRISDVDLGNGLSLARVGKSGSGVGSTDAGSDGTGGTTAGGIGGTWTAPTGEIIELVQKGSRITGRYNGILGLGEISGTFDGKNLSATVKPNQGLLPLAIPLRLTLIEGGKLLGRLETPLISESLVFTKNR